MEHSGKENNRGKSRTPKDLQETIIKLWRLEILKQVLQNLVDFILIRSTAVIEAKAS